MTVAQLAQKIVTFILVADIGVAYKLVCPHSSQRWLRSHGFCVIKNNTKSVYTCLEDINENKFVESCSEEEDVVGAGERYVVKGESTNGDCSTQRYQPIPFYKTSGSECMFLISGCSESGQVTGMNGLGKNDTACICDYNNGYAYVTRPDDVCNCKPTREDCTCYEKHCPENRRLTAENECIHRSATSMTECTSIATVGTMSVVTTPLLTALSLLESKSENRAFIPAWFIVIISAFLGGLLITYMLICWYKYRKKKEQQDFYVRVIGHWKSLKAALDQTIFPLMVKNGFISIPDSGNQKNKPDSDSQNFVLYSLLTENKTCVSKRNQILHQQKTLKAILQQPVVKPLWHKRSNEVCKRQLEVNNDVLKIMLVLDVLMDDFLQSFIFDLEQHKHIMSFFTNTERIEPFLKLLKDTLYRGSFECLLTQLKKEENQRLRPLLKALTKDLVRASLKGGTIYPFPELKDFKIQISITTATCKGWNDSVLQSWYAWLIEEFGLYPESTSPQESILDISLFPVADEVQSRLIRGIKNGALTRFLEIIFDTEEFKSTINGTFKTEVSITVLKTDELCNTRKLPSEEQTGLQNIISLIKSLINKGEFDYRLFKQRLTERGDKDFEHKLSDDDSQFSDRFIQNLEVKMDKKFLPIFFQILDTEDLCIDNIKKRLLICRKVHDAESPYLQDKFIENFSGLMYALTDIDDLKEICIERNIFSDQFFAAKEQSFTDDRQLQEILIEIIKSGRRDAMLVLVEMLYVNDHNMLASDILYLEPGILQEPGKDDDFITTEKADHGSGLLFTGNFEILLCP